jgi:1-acyl-sn-glycerol-3-phosphate acyltransferase
MIELLCRTPHNNGWSLEARNPDIVKSLLPFYEWCYQHYFQVHTDGWDHIPPQGAVLFVGSHNGGLAAPDMHMFIFDWYRRFGCERHVYGLMHPVVWTAFPPVAHLAVAFGAIRADPRMAIAALRQPASVLVYPGGAWDTFRLHQQRDRICFFGNQGFIKLALREGVPIIPLISWGAHDTLLVLADFYPQIRQLHDWGMPWLFGLDPLVMPLYLGLPWGFTLGPLPNIPFPVPITTRVCSAITFPRYGRDTLKDLDYVDECYELVVETMQRELDQLIEKIDASNG